MTPTCICPACKANLVGSEIPVESRHYYGGKTHFMRVVGIIEHDRIKSWCCPDCGFETPARKEFEKAPDNQPHDDKN